MIQLIKKLQSALDSEGQDSTVYIPGDSSSYSGYSLGLSISWILQFRVLGTVLVIVDTAWGSVFRGFFSLESWGQF